MTNSRINTLQTSSCYLKTLAGQLPEQVCKEYAQRMAASAVMNTRLYPIGAVYPNDTLRTAYETTTYEQSYNEPEAGEIPDHGFLTFIADADTYTIAYYELG